MIVIFFFMQLVLVNISAMLQGGIMKDIFKVAMLQKLKLKMLIHLVMFMKLLSMKLKDKAN